MKTLLISIVFLFVVSTSISQTTIFSDNFESGTTNWTLTGTWGLSTLKSHSSNHSLTESPIGNYANSLTIYATMANGVNLTNAMSAELKFWAIYDIEAGFDYMYVDVSTNGGISWTTIDIFDDTSSVWTQYTYSLGGFVGNSNVKVRFRFVSDVGWVQDGMYIDDIIITSDTVDNSPPLVLHTSPEFYHGSLGSHTATADIIDISGLSIAELIYRVDGGSFDNGSIGFATSIIVGVEDDNLSGLYQYNKTLQCYPNPSSGALHLRYQISEIRNQKCELFSVDGLLVKTLMDGMQQPGKHELEFDLSDLPNGLYLIRLQAGEHVQTAKIILLK